VRYIFQRKLILLVLLLLPLTPTRVYALFPGLNLAVQAGVVKLGGKHRFYDGGGNFGETPTSSLSYAAGGLLGYVLELGTSKALVGFDVSYNKYGASSTGKLAISTGNGSDGKPNTGVSQGNYTLKMLSSMGGSVMGGILLNPKVVVYAKAGYEIIKFSMAYSGLTFDTANSAQTYLVSSKGIVPSIGGALLLSPRVYIGAEYSFPMMQKLKPRDNQVAINGVQRGYSWRPIAHRVLIRLGIRFGGGGGS
jgi:hypothetical protein